MEKRDILPASLAIGAKTLSISQKDLEQILAATHTKDLTLYPDLWSENSPVEFKCIPRSLAIESLFDADIGTQKLVIGESHLTLWGDHYKKCENGTGEVSHYINVIQTIDGGKNKFDPTEKFFQDCGVIEKTGINIWPRDEVLMRKEYVFGTLLQMNLTSKVHTLVEKMKQKMTDILDISLYELENYLQSGQKILLADG